MARVSCNVTVRCVLKQRREEGRTSSKRARDKEDSTQSLLERPDVTSFAAVCLAHRINPLHPPARDLQRVFPARRVNPHRAFVRGLERGFPQQQFRTHPPRRLTS